MRELDIIKRIPITEYLERKGIQVPAKNNICAFWRGDSNPSLHIDISKNCWYDHGTGDCGDIIDLVEKVENCNHYQAIDILKKGCFSLTAIPDITPRKKEPQLIVDSVYELQHPALLKYLNTRGISIEVARRYCKQVYYHSVKSPSHHYFAIGFPNRSGGWELRNRYDKRATGKDLSFIGNEGNHLAIFEGFFDMLSYIELPDSILLKQKGERYAVLNSVAETDKFLKAYPEGIKTVSLYLDSDEAGRKATAKIVYALKKKGIEILFDAGPILEGAGVNDINDLLLHHQQQTA